MEKKMNHDNLSECSGVDNLLSRLKGVKGGNSQYTALCPAHEDRQNSLSIGLRGDKILLRCHAGCATEQIISIIGLTMRDLFLEPKIDNIATNRRRRVAIYDYVDLDGKVIHSTIRYDPKSFSQSRPDPDRPGRYINNLQGVQTALYKLPQITQAIKEKKPIFIVEGEKDADFLEKLGFVATTCPLGAGKWKAHYSNSLVGADVYIVADNDKAGKGHVEEVAKSLSGKAKSIKLVDLAGGLPELPIGGDVTDFFNMISGEENEDEEEGGNAKSGNAKALASFGQAVANAIDYSKLPAKKKSGLVCLADIEPQEVEWLWYPYIPMGKITLLRGDPDQGKTTIMLSIAAIVSNGWPFPAVNLNVGRVINDATDDENGQRESCPRTSKAGNVLLITAEDGLADTIVPRLINAKADRSRVFSHVQTTDTFEPLYYTSPKFEELIKEAAPRLVFADPIQGYLGHSVDGNKANQVRPIMSHLGMLAEKYNAAIVLIEHMGKNHAGSKGIYRGLGSIDFTAAARSVLMAGCDPNNSREKGIAHIKHNLSEAGHVVGYTLSADGLEWNLDTYLTSEMIQGSVKTISEPAENKLGVAKKFLRDALKDGQGTLENARIRKSDIIFEATTKGITERTLTRAKQELGVDSTFEGFGKDKIVYWSLPEMVDEYDGMCD